MKMFVLQGLCARVYDDTINLLTLKKFHIGSFGWMVVKKILIRFNIVMKVKTTQYYIKSRTPPVV